MLAVSVQTPGMKLHLHDLSQAAAFASHTVLTDFYKREFSVTKVKSKQLCFCIHKLHKT